jgi:7-carboxy-7-deazaguanine synthase
MRVTEIFHSLQGEGPLMGEPSVFIRLGGCIEPYCPWCDTQYAWHEYAEMDPGEIIREVSRYDCRDVVITGGEPFLQWESGLITLHGELAGKGCRILYETSGKAGIPVLSDATIVLSPKNIKGKWQLALENLDRAHYFKFVASDIKSLEEIDLFVQVNAIPKQKVYIMPMGATREEQLGRMEMVFTFCATHGYRMSPRLHILVFGEKRGV